MLVHSFPEPSKCLNWTVYVDQEEKGIEREIEKERERKKKKVVFIPLVGLEPTIPGLGNQCLLH